MKYISMIYKSFQGAWVIWGVAGIRQYLFYTKKEAIKRYNAEAKQFIKKEKWL